MLLLFTTSCEPDEIFEINQVENQKSAFQIQQVKLADIPQIRDFLNTKTENIFYKGGSNKNEAFFDTENILEVIDTLNQTNYSFSFFFADMPEGTFYNLIVGKTPEGETKAPYVLKYVCNETQLQTYIANNKNFAYFKGKVSIHKYTDYFTSGYFNKSDVNCPPQFDEVGDPLDCVTQTLDGSNNGGGGGSTGNYGDPNDYGGDNSDSSGDSDSGNNNSSSGENSDSNNSDSESGTGGESSQGGGYQPCLFYDSSGNYLLVDCRQILIIEALQKGDINCPDCPSPTGAVGVNENSLTTIAIEYKIIDNNLDPCSKDILTQLKGLQTNDIAKVLKRFGNPTSVYDWEIKSGAPSNSNNAAETDWLRDSSGNAVDYNYLTNINPTYQNQATKISLARTILHEMLHAYLISLVDDAIITGSSDVTNFPLLWNALVNQTYDNNPNQLQHEIIGRKFIEPLRDALKEWDSSTQSNQYYEDLAWGSLESTATFNTLFPVGSSDRDRILNTNIAEDTNTTQGSITPKGNPC